MRHTGATLWLASGEAPEWIARQMGHANTEMLFKVYSRYVPNLTRQDGSAMERLLASKMSQGPLIENQSANGTSSYVHASDATPQPVPKPRGSAANLSVFKPIRTTSSATGDVQDVDTKVRRGAGPADAKPPPELPPLGWADLAQSWMSNDANRLAA